MNSLYKSFLYDIFQWLIILSVPIIICFYWPNHEIRLMKFISLQTFTTILLALSFLFVPKRNINNFYPAIFLIVGFINLFTHGMNDFINVGVSFILPVVVGIYIISNHLHNDFIPILKKTIVVICLLNCVVFFIQNSGFDLVFSIHHQTPSEEWQGRASGFLCYPASFALLCGVSLFLAWEWKKWLCFPIVLGLFFSHEYSVIGGIFLSFFTFVTWRLNRHCLILIPLAIILGIISWHYFPVVFQKITLRLKYLYPILQNIWARPLDGWGVGMYNRLPDSFFGFPRGNWSEMHCEPLDLFFCMGIMGVACIGGWLNHVKNMNIFYKRIFIVFGFMACFHSPFHFADTIWLFVILYALYEVENYESTP